MSSIVHVADRVIRTEGFTVQELRDLLQEFETSRSLLSTAIETGLPQEAIVLRIDAFVLNTKGYNLQDLQTLLREIRYGIDRIKVELQGNKRVEITEETLLAIGFKKYDDRKFFIQYEDGSYFCVQQLLDNDSKPSNWVMGEHFLDMDVDASHYDVTTWEDIFRIAFKIGFKKGRNELRSDYQRLMKPE